MGILSEILSPEVVGIAVGKIECMALFVIALALIVVLHAYNRRDVKEIKSRLKGEEK